MRRTSVWHGLYTPILVVYDCSLDSPGHAEFFAEEFVGALEPDLICDNGYLKKGRFRIAPVILMTIEDLEILESSVETFGLVDFLATIPVAPTKAPVLA